MRILHLFNWHLNDINKVLEEVSNQGFDAIQINPIQPLKEDGYDHWWMSYQPCDFSIGNQYGTKEELINLCNNARNYNIDIYADVIVNHVAGTSNHETKAHDKVSKKLTTRKDFFKDKSNIQNWYDREQVISRSFGNLPALQVNNEELQDIIIKFLNELLDCGVNGFRFDAAKNIGLPHEGVNFWPRVLYLLNKMNVFIYGEIIFENQDILGHYSKFMNLLTNSYYHNYDQVVSFIESHDTYLDFGYTKNKSEDTINNEYIDLAREYQHTLYYSRPHSNAWKCDKVRFANKIRENVLRYKGMNYEKRL